MVNQEHLNILRQGVRAWNQWRRDHHIQPDLSEADLSKMDLTDANLSETNLVRANLSETTLTGASLAVAKLDKANFRNSILHDANLTTANLHGADLTEASLYWTNFRGAKLGGANFTKAGVAFTIFADVDLSEVIGLATVEHQGPSTIGIDTICLSQSNLPGVFLRRAGVPEGFINSASSLCTQSSEYYSCFISYSSKDLDFVQKLHHDLQSKSILCWYAPKDLGWGQKTRKGLDEAIYRTDKFLLVLSETSIKSQWVEQEVETALYKEREEGNESIIIPIRLDDVIYDVKDGWPRLIQNTRNIGDFTTWRDYGSYLEAFDRLLRVLKVEASRRP